MGILEIHFHDSRFEWTINPESGEERSFSLGTGREAERATTDGGERPRPSVASKLQSLAVLALVVGAGVAYNRLRSRRARKAAEEAEESRGRRFSLSRSK